MATYARHWPKISEQLDRIPQFWSPWWTKSFLQSAHWNGLSVWRVKREGEINLIVYTQILSFPAMNVFQIILILGNDLDKSIPVLEALFEKVAHDNGCQQFEIVGRAGWKRKLKNCKPIATVFRREVPQFGVH